MLTTDSRVQYICTLVCGEALSNFDLLSADVEGRKNLVVETIILGVASYFYPVNSLLRKNRAMGHGVMKARGFKIWSYAARLNDLNGGKTV